MSNEVIKLTILGDICPVKDTNRGFSSGDPRLILDDGILKMISGSDLTVGNLECAVTSSPKPIKKAGPVLHTPPSSIATLANAGFNALSLANNHIRDCGAEGVNSTIKVCKDYNIATFGAGECQKSAKEPFIITIKNRKIAFVSYAEEEFNAASDHGSGAAILDVYYDFDRMARLRSDVDFLIVLYHGGIEYHPYPSPLLKKRCRRMAEAGADLVLCQHSHCIGSYETYGKATILYGQGNNLFGYRRNNDNWNRGLLVQVKIENDNFSVDFIPCETGSDSVLKLSPRETARLILEELNDRSEKISSDKFIFQQWLDFCERAENLNIPLLLGWNRYLIFLNRKFAGWPLRLIYKRRMRNITHNMIRCESHHEVVRTILEKYNFE